jgi:RNase adapter protein RapZ
VAEPLKITVVSFGFKYGSLENADLYFDARELPNPYWVDELRTLTGRDAAVKAWVLQAAGTAELVDHITGVVRWTANDFGATGKTALSAAVGCTGGRHRSVAVAEEVARRLLQEGADVTVEHRDVERPAPE